MSAEQNKKIIRCLFEEGMNQRNFSLMNECIADNYVNHDMPGGEPGPEGFRKVIENFVNGFPDMRIRLDEVIGDGNIVATRGEWSGTHSGNFMGIPATGKKVKIKYIDMWRLENGKGVENWVQMDMPGLMQQLGVMPAPATA
jgi:steroid delta-isomerase-like uncharacterized protein